MEAAQTVDKQILVLNAKSEAEFETAFATFIERRAEGLIVVADPFFITRRDQLVALAARHGVPAIYGFREFTLAGGLMSYGSSPAFVMNTMGNYAGRILKGEQPSSLPVWQAVKVELVLNNKTAKTLGLTFPISLLGRADEVIE